MERRDGERPPPLGRHSRGTFIHLLCGTRSLAEREATVPDCQIPTEKDRVLVQVLFPTWLRRRVGDAGERAISDFHL
jgi:hypothetical protein